MGKDGDVPEIRGTLPFRRSTATQVIVDQMPEDKDSRIFQLERKIEQLTSAMYEVMGKGHIIASDAGQIKRWHTEDGFNVERAAQSVMDRRLEAHHELRWAIYHGPDETECQGHNWSKSNAAALPERCVVPLSVRNRKSDD